MKHLTHTNWLKWIGTAIAGLSIVIAFSFSSAVSAIETSPSTAKTAVTCLVLSKAHNLPQSVAKVYLKRIGSARNQLGTAYWMGYATGMIDAYGFANASKFASPAQARVDAAKSLYKMLGCNINESI